MLAPRDPVTFDTAVSEGIMLAEYAARLQLRNAIIIGAVGESVDYDPRRYMVEARAVVSSLAAEADAAADRIAEQVLDAERLAGRAGHAHDYRSGDVRNLTRRESVSRALAKRLRQFRDDDKYMLALIERSRDEAWRDVSRALEESLGGPEIEVDPEYEAERESRQRDLIEIDLAGLAREREREQLRSELADDWGS